MSVFILSCLQRVSDLWGDLFFKSQLQTKYFINKKLTFRKRNVKQKIAKSDKIISYADKTMILRI